MRAETRSVSQDYSKIYLVGFMGSGKTTLGRLLARRLGWEFHNLDDTIVASRGVSIRTIFEEEGEPRFRALERAALARIAATPGRAVVATGGGTFCAAENRALIERTGVAIWLDQPFDRIWGRRELLADERPLFKGESEARALFETRRDFYGRAAVRILVEENGFEQALEQIVGFLATRSSPP